MTGKWKGLSATCVVLAVLIVAGAALAANQVKGGSYSGALITPANDGVVVSFKVSSNGKQVTALSDLQYTALLQRWRPAHARALQERLDLSERQFTSTGKYVIPEGPKKGQVGHEAEDHRQVPQRWQGAGGADDHLCRLLQLQRKIGILD